MSSVVRGRSRLGRRPLAALAALAVVAVALGFGTRPAEAQQGPPAVDLQILPFGSTTQPSGSVFNYVVQVSCSGVGSASCDDLVVTVPFSSPISSTWIAAVVDNPSDPVVQSSTGSTGTGSLVITLDDEIQTGTVRAFVLQITPPNTTTPDGTTWSLQPSIDGPDVAEPITAPAPASGTATAATSYGIYKNTTDGGTFYQVGSQLTYVLTPQCSNYGLGSLYLESATLVDTLPPGTTYVSSTLGGTSDGNGHVTWDLTGASLPGTCGGANWGGYEVTVTLPAGDDGDVLRNDVSFAGTGIGGGLDDAVTTYKDITLYAESPGVSPGVIGKGSFGPIPEPAGTGSFQGTYAGHWITPIHPRPNMAWWAPNHEASYHVTFNYGADGFQSEVTDGLPCLDDLTGSIYTSPPAGTICANPAFHPTMIYLGQWSAFSAAYADGFRPELVLTDGTVVPMDLDTSQPDGGLQGTAAWFKVPTQHLEDVAAVRLPRHASQEAATLTMRIWGYTDASVSAGQRLDNRAQLTAWWHDAAQATGTFTSNDASVFVVAPETEVGIQKLQYLQSDGSVFISLSGTIASPDTSTGPAVIADLLPAGYSWPSPPSSLYVSVASNGQPGSYAQYPLEVIDDYLGSGRTLVRVELPASVLGAGAHVFNAGFTVQGPGAPGTYTNRVSVFVEGSPLRDSCRGGTTSAVAAYAADDPGDLDGDGVTTEDPSCVASHSLIVPGSGPPAFAVTKTVQGDLDQFPVSSPMVGNVTGAGGTATYEVRWTNVGTGDLATAVVYDVFPYVGDVGISQSQAANPRDSDFATTFVGAGAVPAGVTLEYSASTDPCRPEVNAAASASCTNDWTTNPASLGGPSAVKAVKLSAPGPHPSGSSFAVELNFTTPVADIGDVAWNTVAGSAELGDSPMLPTESPRVGVQVPSGADVPLAGWRALATVGLACAGGATVLYRGRRRHVRREGASA